jgi:hypothetical protein
VPGAGHGDGGVEPRLRRLAALEAPLRAAPGRIGRGSESPELFARIWKTFESRRQDIESVATQKSYFGVSLPTAVVQFDNRRDRVVSQQRHGEAARLSGHRDFTLFAVGAGPALPSTDAGAAGRRRT